MSIDQTLHCNKLSVFTSNADQSLLLFSLWQPLLKLFKKSKFWSLQSKSIKHLMPENGSLHIKIEAYFDKKNCSQKKVAQSREGKEQAKIIKYPHASLFKNNKKQQIMYLIIGHSQFFCIQ